MDSNKDIIELLRECAAQEHGMARLREALGIYPESGWMQRCLYKVADMVDAELGRTYIRLPLDADGVPIRPGDRMERICAEEPYPFKAWFVSSTTDFLSDEIDFYNASECRHVKPDTVEDAIKDMLEEMANERFVYLSSSADKHRLREIVADCTERIRKAVSDEGCA